MNDDAYIRRRSENYIKCVVHDDLCTSRVTGFTSDFLSFIVELIRFFHGALQLKFYNP